jgi:hypothetical protein
MTPNSRRGRSGWFPSFLRHRALAAAEAILAVGLLEGLLESWLRAADVPNYAKVLAIMASTVGLLGGLFWVLQSIGSAGVARTHALLRLFSLPRLAVHAALFAALFFAYAAHLRLPVW